MNVLFFPSQELSVRNQLNFKIIISKINLAELLQIIFNVVKNWLSSTKPGPRGTIIDFQ